VHQRARTVPDGERANPQNEAKSTNREGQVVQQQGVAVYPQRFWDAGLPGERAGGRRQRKGPPAFGMSVELPRGGRDEMHVALISGGLRVRVKCRDEAFAERLKGELGGLGSVAEDMNVRLDLDVRTEAPEKGSDAFVG